MKKEYVKPQIEKHKAVALVSGSGCSSMFARKADGGYWH